MGKRSVIAGCAGSGKSTLVKTLSSRPSIWTYKESGREIANGKIGEKGKLLWNELKNSKDNQELHKKARLDWEKIILAADIEAFEKAPVKDLHCFFDCGIMEAVTYLKLEKIDVPKEFTEAMKKYRYDNVFLTPIWPELMSNPTAVDKAKEFEKLLKELYETNGYTIIEVPHKKPEDRADFVMKHLL